MLTEVASTGRTDAYPDALRKAVEMYAIRCTFPAKAVLHQNGPVQLSREAFSILQGASPNGRLVFLALWGVHETFQGSLNGAIFASIASLANASGVRRRNEVVPAIRELEALGLIRVMRRRGRRAGLVSNCFLLTPFQDFIGGEPLFRA